MSFPPPNSGQYPQYIPPSQYQPGVAPPQLLYNNVAPPAPSPYNGYGKSPVYHPGMMPYQSYPQYGQQPQQAIPPPPQPLMHPHQLQQPPPQPLPQLQQQSPYTQMQHPAQHQQLHHHSPELHMQHPSHLQQQSPRTIQRSSHQQLPQQSPRPQIQQQSPRIQLEHQTSHSQLHQQSPRAQLQQQVPHPQLQQQSPRAQLQQQVSHPQPQQQSPRIQFEQQPPHPQLQQQSPRAPQQSPRPQPQQQSPIQKSQIHPSLPQQTTLQSPVQIASQPLPPAPLPQEEPQHQFINPAELFVQPPLPTAPRSRYTHSAQLDGSTSILEIVPDTSILPPIPQDPPPKPQAPQARHDMTTRPQTDNTTNTQSQSDQQSFQAQLPPKPQPNPQQAFKIDPPRTHSTPKKEAKRPPSTPKTTSIPQQTTPTPAVNSVPQVMIPAPSPEVLKMQKITPKKLRQPNQQHGEKSAKSNKPPIDYQVLLLSLADEYLNAAHRHGTITALKTHRGGVEEYYKLIATGLGCLEAVLKNWRLQPRQEALVRLRYARTLFEETENDLEAETALSKGIDLCERNRMLDLKYSMQHLLARMLHKTNPKASLKAVDGMIHDVEAYRHAAWEYAFRFLRVALSLSSPSHQDSVQALQHLHKIAAMASRNGDKAVSAMAAVIEALAHLQQGAGSDAIEQAQRAVAKARSHQLNDELRHIPQLVTLTQMVDICCSLLDYDINQSSQKLKVMQALVDETLHESNWHSDGSFSIPLNGKSAGPSSIDTGDILQVQNGTLLLSFNWLPQHDLYALSYFLSSITLSAKNSYDGRKAEKYLDEGLRMIQGCFRAPQEITESMVNANRRVEWRRSLYCNFLLQRVFLACSRTDWDLASQALKELRQTTQEIGPHLLRSIECLMEYAAGAIAQGTGDLAAALSTFQSPLLSLSPSTSKTTRNDPCRDTCILAALNTVFIIRDPSHPCHSKLPSVLSTLESFCQNSPNKYIQAAYFLVCATVHTDSTIQTKQFLQQALQSATAISNSQITCMTLTFMSWKYFRGVVGEQAEKSARAGRAMARRANDRLWVSVTDEMLADTLERQGKSEEAHGVRDEGQRLMTSLPSGLKRPA